MALIKALRTRVKWHIARKKVLKRKQQDAKNLNERISRALNDVQKAVTSRDPGVLQSTILELKSINRGLREQARRAKRKDNTESFENIKKLIRENAANIERLSGYLGALERSRSSAKQ